MAVETSSVAGITAGRNPLEYESSNPITLFLFQTVIIIAFCQLIHYPLSKIKQPKVIAEVVTGIILGPSVFGHIPNFTSTVFPADSLPGLTLVANVGLILFLFIVGLEVDIQFVKRNLKIALTVGMINMIVPFGLGCIIAIGLYNDYSEGSSIKFTTFMVFIAVAMCITAFPVLARILTELRLLQDRIGTIVLAAGITNDVVGWMLLALSVTLANAGNGVNTVYILLLMVGWALIICFPVRWALKWSLQKTGDLEHGPSQLSTCGILILVFVSSFYTDIIGIHPIFGAFLVGCVIPRDYGYVVRITEKIEDLVTVVIIPLYFTLAGLKCNLSSLNHGKDWGYIIAIIVIAMFGKIIAGCLASRLNGLLWRESFSVGVLMSCKGIVEIVVLTTGLNAGIITEKVFSMFIVMALICTFLTSPLTLVVYPVWYREKVRRFRAGEISWDGEILNSSAGKSLSNAEDFKIFKFTRVVPVVESLSDVNDLIGFLHYFVHNSKDYTIETYGVSLKRLTQRLKDIIDASNQLDNIDEDSMVTGHPDSLSLILKLFCELNGNVFNSSIRLYSDGNKVSTVADLSSNITDFLVVPISSRVDRSEVVQLSKSIKCNLGLFLNNANPEVLEDKVEHDDDASTSNQTLQGSPGTSKYDKISLILTNEKLTVDLLSLHVFLKLKSSVKTSAASTIFIKGEEEDVQQDLIQVLKNLKISGELNGVDVIYSSKTDAEFVSLAISGSHSPKEISATPLVITSLFASVDNIDLLVAKSHTEHFNLLICNNNF